MIDNIIKDIILLFILAGVYLDANVKVAEVVVGLYVVYIAAKVFVALFDWINSQAKEGGSE